jgi:DNA-directed RNA polymerase subunit RPC12/RpoP
MALSTDQPDLTEFIRKHATPYDPATDTYRRPPFARPVKAKRSGTIYNAHSYHTKVPPEGIVPYIEHYTDPGDLVLDPFCGSGMTGVAALMTDRHVILNELSPAAVHITYNYCTPVDAEALKREFERIKAAVKEEFDWFYGTTCDRCGGPATIQYTIWSDVFECARCGGEIVLWNAAVDPDTGKVAREFACPTCQARWKKTDLQWLSRDTMVVDEAYRRIPFPFGAGSER